MITMKTKIIGIAGKKGVGKDTWQHAINILPRKVTASNIKCAKILKDIALAMHDNWRIDTHLEGKLKEVVDPLYGYSPRDFLQRLGTFLRYITPSGKEVLTTRIMKTNIEQLIRMMELPKDLAILDIVKEENLDDVTYPFSADCNFILITDVRYQDEVDAINSLGGVVYEIRRNTGVSDTHESEQQELQNTIIFDNNGTLQEYVDNIQSLLISDIDKLSKYTRYGDSLKIRYNNKDITLEDVESLWAAREITSASDMDFSITMGDILDSKAFDELKSKLEE